MRQFESIFLERIEGEEFEKPSMAFSARVFAMREELDFAGHPSLGAGAVLHKLYAPGAEEFQCLFKFAKKQVQLTSRKKGTGFIVTLDQGDAEFGAILTFNDTKSILSCLNLTTENVDVAYPVQVVSTGLPYLIIPLKVGISLAKITGIDLQARLKAFGAKFIGLLEVTTQILRTWDIIGNEDIATGSLAGPAGAFLSKYSLPGARSNDFKFNQGHNLGRPSALYVKVLDPPGLPLKIQVSGRVVPVAQGMLTLELSKELKAGLG